MKQNKNMDDKKISKREQRKKQENIEKIAEVIENKNKISKNESEKINNKVFENILFAIFIMLYLYFVILGSININVDAFIIDLKVFSIILLLISVILFEMCFKKSNINICIHGIEILILAITSLVAIYLYSLYIANFKLIIALISFAFGLYFLFKSIIIYVCLRKKHLEKENDIKDIVKREK